MAYNNYTLVEQYEDRATAFIKQHLKDCKNVEDCKGIDFRILLTVSALETGWGSAVKGNNYFGIKYGRQEKALITTTEYSAYNNLKFPEIISITPAVRNGRNMYKYIVKDYFLVYLKPYDSFFGYVKFLEDNPRYKTALEFKKDPLQFFKEVARAGYATAPDYAKKLAEVFNSVNRRL